MVVTVWAMRVDRGDSLLTDGGDPTLMVMVVMVVRC